MSPLGKVMAWLNAQIGLDRDSIGNFTVQHAVATRMAAVGARDEQAYIDCLEQSHEEGQALIEAIVVPETWFFRDQTPFDFLSRWVAEEWLPRHAEERLQILSMPCSTGEEAYSVAMLLLRDGVKRFEVEGLDISVAALNRAREGVYRRNSFRGSSCHAWSEFLDPVGSGELWRVNDRVRQHVRWDAENLLSLDSVKRRGSKQVILCRNLLIYMDKEAQMRLLEVVEQLLAPEGILIVGHAETYLVTQFGFEPAGVPMAFAFRKRGVKARTAAAKGRIPLSVPVRAPVQRPAPASPGLPVAAKEGLRSVEFSLDECERLANAGDLELAAQQCEGAMKARGPSARGCYLFGLIEDARGNSDRAIEFYGKALYLDPDYTEALAQMALLLRKNGETVKARHAQRRLERLEYKRLRQKA